MANRGITTICQCEEQQYAPIIFDNVGYQNGANTLYQNMNDDVARATTGTRIAKRRGFPIFKSNADRIAYKMGQQNQISGCGVPKKVFTLGTN